MRELWRNREVRIQAGLWLAAGILLGAAGFCLNRAAGGMAVAVWAVLTVLNWGNVIRRYREIRRLSEETDRILHGEERLELEECREGDLAVLRDEIYKMTVRLREQKDRLEEDKKYLADSLADISHQIRTPVTSLNLTVSMLQQEEMGGQRQRVLLREMKKLLGRVEWLVESLLKLSKLDAGSIPFHLERIELESFLRQAAEPLEIPLELRGQNLLFDVEEGSFLGDRTWTQEAVLNVLKNCMEHNPTGGTLRISGRENPLYAEITIEDEGPGIDPEDLPHLFERFYRGKQAAEGSFGIGLALARAILIRENGMISAFSRPGKGSCFSIRIYKGTV